MTEISAAIEWGGAPEGLDAIAAELSRMRAAAGQPSFAAIGRAVAQLRAARGAPPSEQRIARSTLYDCFRPGRRRVDHEAVIEIAMALGLPAADRHRWAQRVAAAQARTDGAAVAIVHERAPAPVPYFCGSEDLLVDLAEKLQRPSACLWLAGMPGSGKSQLAFAVADLLAAAGIESLFLDLRGYHAQSPPVDPIAAQRAVLRSLGQPDTEDAHRKAHLLSALRDSGRLLILDDALDAAHATAILGEEPACRVLVTSRMTTAPRGWLPVTPHPMSLGDVEKLFSQFSGAHALAPAAIESFTSLAGGLPLVLSLVAARLKSHPHWSLQEQAEYLRQRLQSAQLDAELTVSLRLSYDTLSSEAAALLRQFADLPIAEMSPTTAAIVMGVERASASEYLAELLESGLAIAREGDRLALHSVVRSFAKAQARETDPPSQRDAAFTRITAHVAGQVWRSYAELARSMDDQPRPTEFEYPREPWDIEAATAWLGANLADILALAHAAPGRGAVNLQWRISEGLSLWMAIVGHIGQALLLHEAAAATAAQYSDHNALAMASLDAGQLLVQLDQPDRALAHFQRATRLIHSPAALTDPGLRGLLLNMSGLVDLRYGRLSEARTALREAVEIHEDLGEDSRLMSALVNLGLVLQARGDYEEEARVCERGLGLARAKEHTMMIANFLINRSRIHAIAGRPRRALADAQEAGASARGIQFAYLEAMALSSAADAHRRLGEVAEANTALRRALEITRELGTTLALAELLVVAADLAATDGDTAAALDCLVESESLLPPDRDPILRGSIFKRRADLASSLQERNHWWRKAHAEFGESNSTDAQHVRSALGI